MTPALRIEAETPLRDDVRRLVAALNATMKPLTPPQFQFQLTVERMAEPGVTTFIARDDAGRALGMASLEEHGDGLGEVKRMYTLPETRGLRIGSRLLHRVEALRRVYERNGFRTCGAVPDYPDSGYSRFYEKMLAR